MGYMRRNSTVIGSIGSPVVRYFEPRLQPISRVNFQLSIHQSGNKRMAQIALSCNEKLGDEETNSASEFGSYFRQRQTMSYVIMSFWIMMKLAVNSLHTVAIILLFEDALFLSST
ncbi:hypothetical protein ACU8KH_02582 [Lachancea thermotolerans]